MNLGNDGVLDLTPYFNAICITGGILFIIIRCFIFGCKRGARIEADQRKHQREREQRERERERDERRWRIRDSESNHGSG